MVPDPPLLPPQGAVRRPPGNDGCMLQPPPRGHHGRRCHRCGPRHDSPPVLWRCRITHTNPRVGLIPQWDYSHHIIRTGTRTNTKGNKSDGSVRMATRHLTNLVHRPRNNARHTTENCNPFKKKRHGNHHQAVRLDCDENI